MIYKVMSMPPAQLSAMLYPRAYQITDLPQVLSSLEQGTEANWGHVDPTSNLLVKPEAVCLKLTKALQSEVLLIDDAEYLTVLVGSQSTGTEFMNEVFGVDSAALLKRTHALPAFTPVEENQSAQLL